MSRTLGARSEDFEGNLGSVVSSWAADGAKRAWLGPHARHRTIHSAAPRALRIPIRPRKQSGLVVGAGQLAPPTPKPAALRDAATAAAGLLVGFARAVLPWARVVADSFPPTSVATVLPSWKAAKHWLPGSRPKLDFPRHSRPGAWTTN